jgi:hypothetical protein
MSPDNAEASDAAAWRDPDPWVLSRLSWGSIFAGFFVAAALHVMLAMIAVSFGLRFHYSSESGESAMQLTAAGGVVWALSTVIALWAGGWVAGRTAGHGYGNVGGLHGVVVWGVAVTFASLLISGRAHGRMHDHPMALADHHLPALAAWCFLILALGAFAAGWGGRCGARRAGYFHQLI